MLNLTDRYSFKEIHKNAWAQGSNFSPQAIIYLNDRYIHPWQINLFTEPYGPSRFFAHRRRGQGGVEPNTD